MAIYRAPFILSILNCKLEPAKASLNSCSKPGGMLLDEHLIVPVLPIAALGEPISLALRPNLVLGGMRVGYQVSGAVLVGLKHGFAAHDRLKNVDSSVLRWRDFGDRKSVV